VKSKIIGVVPARMAASRFPGKPLVPILGRPMIDHVIGRAKLYGNWDELVLTTCDEEIAKVGRRLGIPVIMTGSHHTRALDRVAEAACKLPFQLKNTDIVVCVQGDEPMLRPDMIEAVVRPLQESDIICCTVLAMHITEKEIWENTDTVKIIYNAEGEVLYTSRMPMPYARNGFSPALLARRIYGIFAFRWKNLLEFTRHPETHLERLESCDSNRILDMNFTQHIAAYPCIKSFSVDSPEDIMIVEKNMSQDPLFGSY